MGGKSIYLWNTRHYGVPQNIEEVEKTWNRLNDDVPDTRQEGFIHFAKKFTQYLEAHHDELEEDIHSCYVNLMQEAKKHQQALIHLDLPHDEWLETLRIIVTITPSCDLLVYEYESGMAFLPLRGKVLPESQALPWQNLNKALDAPASFPRTKAQFKKYAKPFFDEWLREHGFTSCKKLLSDGPVDAYSRNVPLGKQYISIPCDDGGGGSFPLKIYADVESQEVWSIYNQFNFAKFSTDIFLTNNENLNHRGPWRVENKFEFDLAWYSAEELLMPILDAMQTLSDVNRLLNGTPNELLPERAYNKQFYAPQRLIISRLVGDPNFESLVTELEGYPSFAGNDYGRETEWPKLVKYLREEVKPIV